MADFAGLPEGGELWNVDGQDWVVYFVPGTEPPVPMAWRVGEGGTDALFPSGAPVGPDRTMTQSAFESTGALTQGVTQEIQTAETHPFEAFVSQMESEARVAPWLLDPEMMAVYTAAMLENREPSMAELQSTEWWRTHSDNERQWLQTYHSDPATADDLIDDNRLKVRDLLAKSGITSPPESVINTMADMWTRGVWTQDYLTEQARLLGDRWAIGAVDPALKDALEGVTLETNRDLETKVRDLYLQWLGPAYTPSDHVISQWAAQLRNDPNAEERLVEDYLKPQRLALFPEYENENLTYETIAAPWRNVVSQVWGEVPDETSSHFQKVVRMNDREQAEDYLRRVGVKQGKGKVIDDSRMDFSRGLGGGVQESAI